MSTQQAEALLRLAGAIEFGIDAVISLLIMLIFVGLAQLIFANGGSNSVTR